MAHLTTMSRLALKEIGANLRSFWIVIMGLAFVGLSWFIGEHGFSFTGGQVNRRVDYHGLYLQKILEQLQTGALTFLRVELYPKDIVSLNNRSEGNAVIYCCHNVRRVLRNAVVAVDEID